jgi:hypothetical protein
MIEEEIKLRKDQKSQSQTSSQLDKDTLLLIIRRLLRLLTIWFAYDIKINDFILNNTYR